ncbi:MAG: hypothetical protein ACXABD_18710 [Candidatus Thorarchaeota archaeon]|jgi:hypothetical protein
MEEENNQVAINNDDVLVITLLQFVAQWGEVEPTDYKKWINGLMPLERPKGEKPRFQCRPLDIEVQCLIQGCAGLLDNMNDNFTGSMLICVLKALREAAFTWPSRQMAIKPGQTAYWAIRRHKGVAWWTECEPSDIEKLHEIMGRLGQ